MRPKKITITPVTDDDGIATSQTPSGAGDLTLDGALASGGTVTFNHPHLVTIAGGSNESGKTFTVYGYDERNIAASEAVTGPNNSTVATTGYFSKVTRIAVSAATAGAVKAGVNGKSVTNWIPVDHRKNPFDLSMIIDITGAMTWGIQHTISDIQDAAVTIYSQNHGTLTAETADNSGDYDSPIKAMRAFVSAYTNGSLNLYLQQGG